MGRGKRPEDCRESNVTIAVGSRYRSELLPKNILLYPASTMKGDYRGLNV
jgi:hypothetical protein